MATITRRKVHGRVYYYLVESKRIDGKPRLVLQKYLGRAEDVVERLKGTPPTPHTVTVGEYGGSRILWAMARRLRLVEWIDAAAPKRTQGLSVGTYLVLAAINRVLAPCSKAQFRAWYRATALYHDCPVRDADLSSQRFWDHLGYLTPDRIRTIETTLTQHMVAEFGLELSTVVYDATNFYTWIDTNTPATLAQRGHQKQHRTDLKAMSLGLLVTTDFNIPLFHAIYPGNRGDSTEFGSITEDLVDRYQALRAGCEQVTLIYDKGNDSQTNQAAVDASPFSFVGSLKANQAPELLAVSRDQFAPVPGFAGLSAYRTRRKVFGVERTVVVTYNEALFLGQWQGELVRLRKLQDRLHTIQRSVERGSRRPSVAALRQRVAAAVAKAGPPVRHWVSTTVTETDEGAAFAYAIDTDACMAWGTQHWGKTLLFTDHDDWSTGQIIAAYRDAWHVEQTFRDLKHPQWLHGQPQFHWTDDKIRVHGFICVLAVILAHLLHRECVHAGIDLSLPALLQELTSIHEVAWMYPQTTRLAPQLTLTERTPRQQQLLDLFAIPLPAAPTR